MQFVLPPDGQTCAVVILPGLQFALLGKNAKWLMPVQGLPWWLRGKESAGNAGDVGSIPGSGRSPGEENGNSLQYSYLGNLMDRGSWQAIVHGVANESNSMWEAFGRM